MPAAKGEKILGTKAYENAIRPLLFRLPPETARRAADVALRAWPLWKAASALNRPPPLPPVSLAGIELANPVGLAAGYDKDCALLPALSALGFGYLTVGTVTRDARPGNPGRRILRDAARGALVNSLGFPGKGLAAAARRLERGARRAGDAPIVVSVSGTTVEDIAACHARLEPLADAVEVNISSPNTAGLRAFHDRAALGELLGEIAPRRAKPLFVKMPPFPPPDEDAERHRAALALAEESVSRGADALTVSNTQPVSDARLGVGAGGLSGKPIFSQTLRMVSETRARIENAAAINACGGIFTSDDARQALESGADTVQLLTAFIYRGPGVARDIARGLADTGGGLRG